MEGRSAAMQTMSKTKYAYRCGDASSYDHAHDCGHAYAYSYAAGQGAGYTDSVGDDGRGAPICALHSYGVASDAGYDALAA